MSMWSSAMPPAPAAPWYQQAATPAAIFIALAVVLASTLLLLLLNRQRQRQGGGGGGSNGQGLPKSVAKAAYESLRARELGWLRGLPPQAQAALLVGTQPNGAGKGAPGRRQSSLGGSKSSFPAHELLHSGEVGMLLVGVKPSVVVEDRGPLPFAEAYEAGVLRPWMEEFGLAEYGFVLTKVASPCAPPETRGHPGFQGAALLYWKLHPEASFVESIFLGSHPSMPSRLLGEALGYPGREGRLAVDITYLSLDTAPYASGSPALPPLTEEEDEDEDEDNDTNSNGASSAAAPIGGGDSLRVPLLRYVGREEDGQRIGGHFRRVGELFMTVFQQPLALDLGKCEGWDAGALAKLLVAAFPSAFDDEEVKGGNELGGLLRCLESGALVPHDWMRTRFPELPPIVRMLRLVEKLKQEKMAEGR